MHPGNRADYLFLARLGVDMWGMYPKRFLSLLEHMLTDGMSDEDRAEWDADLKDTGPDIDESMLPILEDMVRMRQAVDVLSASELIRLGDQLAKAEGNESKQKRIMDRMNEIRAEAMEAST